MALRQRPMPTATPLYGAKLLRAVEKGYKSNWMNYGSMLKRQLPWKWMIQILQDLIKQMQKVEQNIEKINEALKDKPVSKEVKQKLSYAKKNWPSNLKKYEEQERIMGEERSSYSKTDTDATFMPMKEDQMQNGQLKAAYNVQMSTNNQIIASYSISQKTTDTNTLTGHLELHQKDFSEKAETVTTDAGQGSEENYQWLEDNNITAYGKHNQFDRQQNETIRDKKPFASDKLYYNKEQDCYYCPMDRQ